MFKGIILWAVIVLVYLTIYHFVHDRWQDRVNRIDRVNELGETRKEKKEDETTRKDRKEFRTVLSGSRESSMLTMGSIFIAASVLLLTASIQPGLTESLRAVLAWGSPIIYLGWLFMVQLTGRLVDDAEITMLVRSQGPDNPFEVLREFHGGKHGKSPVMWFRRNHWLFYLLIFIIAANLITTSPSGG